MPGKMKVALLLSVATLLAVAVMWIKADMDAWAETTIMTIDEPEERFVTVERGDTLSHIAVREWPNRDPRKGVYELLEVNPWIGKDCLIKPGQKVRLP